MCTPDQYTPDDFARGDTLLSAYGEVALAYGMRPSLPKPGDLAAPFDQYLRSADITSETINNIALDPQVAYELALHGLRDGLRRREHHAATARILTAETQLVETHELFRGREFAAFPTDTNTTLTVTTVKRTMTIPRYTAAEVPAVTGYLARTSDRKRLRFQTMRQSLRSVVYESYEIGLFPPGSGIQPAIRLAITERSFVDQTRPHQQRPAPRSRRVVWKRP